MCQTHIAGTVRCAADRSRNRTNNRWNTCIYILCLTAQLFFQSLCHDGAHAGQQKNAFPHASIQHHHDKSPARNGNPKDIKKHDIVYKFFFVVHCLSLHLFSPYVFIYLYCFPVLPCPPLSAFSRCATSSNVIFGWFSIMRNWQIRSFT